jgi:F0F1-type ATP synthase delta subunit
MAINKSQRHEEVRKMIFRLTPDDALKAIKSVSDDFPEAMEKIFSRVPEEERVRTINVILRHISKERRIEVINAFIRHISEDKLKELAKEILDGKK